MSTILCDPKVWARCPGHEYCGVPADFTQGSECDRYNQKVLAELPEDGWISVKERLPEVEKEVLILCNINGHKIVTTAMYEDGTNTTENSTWWWNDASDFCKYDEENDLFIIPEGWWEYRHFNPDDVYNNAVDIPVTHWMPLPEPPEVHNESC